MLLPSFGRGLIDAVTSLILKSLSCFRHQSTPSSLILCALFKLFGDYSCVGNVDLDVIFETLQWPTMLSLFLRELIIEKLLLDSVIIHPYIYDGLSGSWLQC